VIQARGLATALLACLLAGCAATPTPTEPALTGGCPESLRQGIRITASDSQVAIPDGVRVASGAVPLMAGVGRRVLLALDVSPGVSRIRILSSSIEMLTFGGTLAGWARVVAPAAATGQQSIQAADGFLRIAPFLPGKRLAPYTETVDVVVVPGGARVAGLALHPGRMWDAAGRATQPKDLAVALVPILHLKVLDVVTATARLEFTAVPRSHRHERWQCSIESDFELVDHRAALPNLWVLQPAERIGSNQPVLALYNARVGAIAAVFRDPATASGFARWLRETHARRIGKYDVGFTSKTIAAGFQPASGEGPGELSVQELGER
jgi:hypothetical protein